MFRAAVEEINNFKKTSFSRLQISPMNSLFEICIIGRFHDLMYSNHNTWIETGTDIGLKTKT